jgi:spore germination cell wall hydrolase CwlJ-like protein
MKLILAGIFLVLGYQFLSFYEMRETQKLLISNQHNMIDYQYQIIDRIEKLESERFIVTKPMGPIPKVEELRKQPEAPKLKIVKTGGKLNHKQLDIFCMAKNIYHEAGNQNKLGKYAVAQVTINRKLSSNYPNTVCDVVMQAFQFSWANDRKIRWTRPKGPVWEESLRIAEEVIRGGKRVEGLGTALFYHADYVSPNWKKPEAKLAKVGAHIFYADAR